MGRQRRDRWECWHFGSSVVTGLAPLCPSGQVCPQVSGILPLGKRNHEARFGPLGTHGVLSSAEGHAGQGEAVQAQEGTPLPSLALMRQPGHPTGVGSHTGSRAGRVTLALGSPEPSPGSTVVL